MDKIEQKYIEANGLKLHVAEIGNGSNVVLFCHGFPEIWYSWRYQMIAVAKAGYRAIAPDYRGFGLSDAPPVPEQTTYSDILNDLYSLLCVLDISKVFIIAKDFGARVAYLFTLLHPGRVAGVVTLGIPFLPPKLPPITEYLPEGFYVSRWQEPGRAEADFGRFDTKTVVRNIYVLFSGTEIPIAGENQEIMDLVDSSISLPSWITEEDLATYGALYEKSGFQTGLQVTYSTKHYIGATTLKCLKIMAWNCSRYSNSEEYRRSIISVPEKSLLFLCPRFAFYIAVLLSHFFNQPELSKRVMQLLVLELLFSFRFDLVLPSVCISNESIYCSGR